VESCYKSKIHKMKKIILLALVAIAAASCKPCEQECKFNEGDEVNIKAKSFVNNNGVVTDVDHHMDCSCYYTVSHSNMINIEYEYDYDEFEIEKR
jgi:transcription antitermination factor NusG